MLTETEEEIKHQATDTSIIYALDCVGCMTVDTCKANIRYLFWMKNGRYYTRSFGRCIISEIRELTADNPLSFFLSNSDKVIYEQVQHPTAIKRVVRKDGEAKEEKIMMDIDHYRYHAIVLQAGKDVAVKMVPDYFFNTKEFSSGRPNIYYDTNRNTKLYTLIVKIEDFLEKNP